MIFFQNWEKGHPNSILGKGRISAPENKNPFRVFNVSYGDKHFVNSNPEKQHLFREQKEKSVYIIYCSDSFLNDSPAMKKEAVLDLFCHLVVQKCFCNRLFFCTTSRTVFNPFYHFLTHIFSPWSVMSRCAYVFIFFLDKNKIFLYHTVIHSVYFHIL